MEMVHSQPMEINGVYYAESKDRVLNPVAIRPTFSKERVMWEDTNRGFMTHPTSIRIEPKDSKNPDRIIINTQNNEEIILTKLSLDVYNKYVKKRVAGKPDFNSDQELIDYYLNTDFQAY